MSVSQTMSPLKTRLSKVSLQVSFIETGLLIPLFVVTVDDHDDDDGFFSSSSSVTLMRDVSVFFSICLVS